MIQKDVITNTLVRTYSDLDHYIELDGAMYEEAVHPDDGRVFNETEIPIDRDEESRRAYAYNLLTEGGAVPSAEKLKKQRAAINDGIEDKGASIIPEFFPKMKYAGDVIPAGSRTNWNGTIKRAAVDLWDIPENAPDVSPELWEDIAYKEGYRIIPDVITAASAFKADEYGWWGDVLYRALIDNNVWTPEEYPSGWEVVV